MGMLIPLIKVKDRMDGSIRIVGTDAHDTLHIDDNGHIAYYNLQNGEGTGGDYSFVGEEREYSPWVEIEFVTIEEFVKMAEQHDAEMEAEHARLLDYVNELRREEEGGLMNEGGDGDALA